MILLDQVQEMQLLFCEEGPHRPGAIVQQVFEEELVLQKTDVGAASNAFVVERWILE